MTNVLENKENTKCTVGLIFLKFDGENEWYEKKLSMNIIKFIVLQYWKNDNKNWE